MLFKDDDTIKTADTKKDYIILVSTSPTMSIYANCSPFFIFAILVCGLLTAVPAQQFQQLLSFFSQYLLIYRDLWQFEQSRLR